MITLKRFAFKPDIWAQRQRRGVVKFRRTSPDIATAMQMSPFLLVADYKYLCA